MNNTHRTRRTLGFTMIEIMIVIVVIGILAAIAFPRYRNQMIRIKMQEAIPILMTVWDAQKEYYRENGSYLTALGFDAVNTGLDIEIPTPKNFDMIWAYNAGTLGSCPGPRLLARIQTSIPKVGGRYYLYVLEDGRIVCSCTDTFLQRLGFSGNW